MLMRKVLNALIPQVDSAEDFQTLGLETVHEAVNAGAYLPVETWMNLNRSLQFLRPSQGSCFRSLTTMNSDDRIAQQAMAPGNRGPVRLEVVTMFQHSHIRWLNDVFS